MTNVLDLVDQTVFLGERATGATNLLQCVWMYNRAIDIAGLRRFHHHLQRGRLSRQIEQSPLPFGRHRWVSPSALSTIEIVAAPRPREEFDAWLSEQANTPLDSQHGPGWHLAVLPFTDGGTGVSLVISHCLADGVGLCQALADAASGRNDAISWPLPDHVAGGAHCVRTPARPRATHPPSGAPWSPRHECPDVATVMPARPRRHRSRSEFRTNGLLSRRRRSSSM
jgi:hypothetical protein